MKIPRPYQREAINYIKDHNTYLTDSCGLGKTLTSIESVIEAGLAEKRNLVICRKSARQQWKEEIQDQIPPAEVIITDHVRYKFREIPGWYVTHYDEYNPRSLLYPIASVVWDAIIIDEAHKLRNHSIARSKNITKISGVLKIAMSATPIEHHGGELWPLLKWLAPDKFPAYWKWVHNTFEVSKGYFGGFEIGEPLDKMSYLNEIRPYIIHRTKEEVAPELPKRVDIDVPIEMEGKLLDAYQEINARKDVLVKIEDVEMLITNALALHTRLHQLSVLPMLLGFDYPSPKLVWLDDFLEDHSDMKVLVFSRYREVIETVKGRYLGKYKVLQVMSGINESEEFKRGDSRILAGTIDAMSESLSLEMADAAIFLDQHWSSTQMQQAVDRIHRMNITSTKFIYYLQASKADRRVMKVVRGKQSEQQMLLDFVYGK